MFIKVTYGGKRAKKNNSGVKVGNVKCSFSCFGSSSSASFSEVTSNPLNTKPIICYTLTVRFYIKNHDRYFTRKLMVSFYLQIDYSSHAHSDQNQKAIFRNIKTY